MSEVRTDGQSNGPGGGIVLPSPAGDPLASLHKMSTTAGLGSQEYVAINVTAVVAMLLGISSVLALMLKLLLILPLAGAVCAILALLQIRRSNGTQTGSAFAIAGLLLSLGFGGYVFASEGIKQMRGREDEQQIAALMEKLGSDVAAQKYSDAYALFSERFHGRLDGDAFKARLEAEQRIPELGRLQSVAWNQEPVFFETNPDTAVQTGTAMAFLNFEKSSVPSREIMLFMKQGGSWRIEDIPQVFPAARPAPGGPGGPGGGPGGPGGGPGGPPGQGAPAGRIPAGPTVPK